MSMNHLNNMKRALGAIGVYEIISGSRIHNELSSYVSGFEQLEDGVNDALRETFVSTAADIGLSSYEEIVGAPRDGESISSRREMVLALLNVNSGDFTLAGIQRYFESFGFECDITEEPQFYNLLITPRAPYYTPTERAYIRARAEAFLPCHLSYTIEFRLLQWDNYDAYGNTFDAWDALNLDWDHLDRYER